MSERPFITTAFQTISDHEFLIETQCARCQGSGIDPVRTGFATDHEMMDPDWCHDCGGGGDEYVDLACLLVNLWVAIGLAAARDVAYREGFATGHARGARDARREH